MGPLTISWLLRGGNGIVKSAYHWLLIESKTTLVLTGGALGGVGGGEKAPIGLVVAGATNGVSQDRIIRFKFTKDCTGAATKLITGNNGAKLEFIGRMNGAGSQELTIKSKFTVETTGAGVTKFAGINDAKSALSGNGTGAGSQDLINKFKFAAEIGGGALGAVPAGIRGAKSVSGGWVYCGGSQERTIKFKLTFETTGGTLGAAGLVNRGANLAAGGIWNGGKFQCCMTAPKLTQL